MLGTAIGLLALLSFACTDKPAVTEIPDGVLDAQFVCTYVSSYYINGWEMYSTYQCSSNGAAEAYADGIESSSFDKDGVYHTECETYNNVVRCFNLDYPDEN